MRWSDLKHLKSVSLSVSLMVGAGALAVVLAMNSDAHAKRRPHRHHPGELFHLISDDHNERSKKHHKKHHDRHGRSTKHHQLSHDHAALSAKLDEVLLAINGPSTGAGLSEKLDEVLITLTDQPSGGALPCVAATSGNRFVVSPDGTEVCDNTTGLIWEQMPDSVLRPWQAAIDFCPTLGTGYRLPDVKELISWWTSANSILLCPPAIHSAMYSPSIGRRHRPPAFPRTRAAWSSEMAP